MRPETKAKLDNGLNGKKSLLVPRFPAVMALVMGVKNASTSDRI